MRLHLGCGRRHLEGYVNVDGRATDAADIVLDLEGPWPWEAESVEEIVAHHVLEHLHDLPSFMDKAHRVLRAGGVLDVRVPHHRHRNADTDPSHVRCMTEDSLAYWYPDTLFEPHSDLKWQCTKMEVVGGLRVPLLWRFYPPARYWYVVAPREIHWRLEPIKPDPRLAGPDDEACTKTSPWSGRACGWKIGHPGASPDHCRSADGQEAWDNRVTINRSPDEMKRFLEVSS